MLALIAGTGDLPPALLARLPERPLICAMDGFVPAITPDITFRIEHLGSFLQELTARGVTDVCMAGAVKRPAIDPSAIDAATVPLVPRVQAAMAQGDDGALRVIISVFEEAGFEVVAAHEVAPDLLPITRVLTKKSPKDRHRKDAKRGEACVADMGAADVGQACLIRDKRVVATEGPDGTDAMLDRYAMPLDPQAVGDVLDIVTDVASDMLDGVADWLVGEAVDKVTAAGAILFKAPKPGQDRRVDLPVIGPGTAERAVKAALAGIVVEAQGVMVLDETRVVEILDQHGLFLWVRPKGGA